MVIVRPTSPRLGDCELTWRDRIPIDVDLARRQQRAYVNWLAARAEVLTLDDADCGPDQAFVEDLALIADPVAVAFTPRAVSRRGEVQAVRAELARHRPVLMLPRDLNMDGGDVLRVGQDILAGLSTRSSRHSANALEELLKPYGYCIRRIAIHGCLHLKTALSSLGQDRLLVDPEHLDTSEIAKHYELIEVCQGEPSGANILRVENDLLVSASAPSTARLLRRMGFNVDTIDISEFEKAEAGLTCLSILIN